MPLRCSLLRQNGKKEKYTDLVPDDLWMAEEEFEDGAPGRIIAVYLPPDDYGAEVHQLDASEHNLDEILWEYQETGEAPVNLISDETQIGFVFPNTSLKVPTRLAPECGRILLEHSLSPWHLN